MRKHLHKILESIFQFYGHLRIRTKIMLNFFIVIILITVSVGWFYYQKAASMVETEITDNMQGILDQADINIQSIVASIEESSLGLYSNSFLRTIYLRNKEEYPQKQQFEDYSTLTDICSTYLMNKNISSIQLYFSNGAFYTREKVNFLTVEDAKKSQWYQEAGLRNGSILWQTISADNMISCSRALVDYSVADGELGYISINIKETKLSDILKRIENRINGEVYLINSKNEVVSAVNKSLIGKPFQYETQLENLINQQEKAADLKKEGENHLLMTSCSNPEWRIVALISLTEVQKRNTEIIGAIIIISGIVFVVAIIMAVVLSASITGRIKELALFMKRVEINQDKLIAVKYSDEISELERNFNKMLKTTRELINEVYSVRLSKKETELRALQAQINPHFLYNALDCINWMANKYKAAEISKMSRLLGSFFRLSLSKGKDIVSIRNEIEHAKVYVEIMQIRFKDDININFEIDKEVFGFETIKLIFQPVIENAILHGIQGRPEQRGNITVKGFKKDDILFFYIIDDGIGIRPEILEKLPVGIESSSVSGGYGVKNVHERIQLYFGDKYGLVYNSTYGVGTTVEISLPSNPYNG